MRYKEALELFNTVKDRYGFVIVRDDDYLTAPRMAISTKVGKGLVIYNSTVKETEAIPSSIAVKKTPMDFSGL